MNGIINVKKEQGFTSFDVVAKLRGIYRQKKIGHTGTLDPGATGVLLVCLGNATKVCDLLTDRDKEYEACFALGISTDTQDTSGQLMEKREVNVSCQEIESVLESFVGEYEQLPPMFSAKKVDGKRLYELARSGVSVERKKCRVNIMCIELLGIYNLTDRCEKSFLPVNRIGGVFKDDMPFVKIRVKCSKGTYIRTLCSDIGDKLGCGAAMVSLTRTRVGNYPVEDAMTLAEIEQAVKNGKAEEILLKTDTAFKELEAVTVSDNNLKALLNGNKLKLNERICGRVRVYDENGRFYAVYESEGKGLFSPVKMFLE